MIHGGGQKDDYQKKQNCDRSATKFVCFFVFNGFLSLFGGFRYLRGVVWMLYRYLKRRKGVTSNRLFVENPVGLPGPAFERLPILAFRQEVRSIVSRIRVRLHKESASELECCERSVLLRFQTGADRYLNRLACEVIVEVSDACLARYLRDELGREFLPIELIPIQSLEEWMSFNLPSIFVA